jgi:hypothetical protein
MVDTFDHEIIHPPDVDRPRNSSALYAKKPHALWCGTAHGQETTPATQRAQAGSAKGQEEVSIDVKPQRNGGDG